MSSLLTILGRSALLQSCGSAVLEELAVQARIVQLPLGQTFQRAGQLPPGAALLLEGRLRRLLSRPGGGAPISLGFVEPGQWVSWTALWRAEPEVTLTASKPSALLMVPAGRAIAALQRHASLRQALAEPSFEELASLLVERWQRDGVFLEAPLQRLEQFRADCALLQTGDQLENSQLPGDRALLYSGPRAAGAPAPGERLELEPAALRRLLSTPINGLPPRILLVPRATLALPQEAAPAPVTEVSSLATRSRRADTSLDLEPATPEEHGFQPDVLEASPFQAGASSRVDQAVACILYLAAARKVAFSEELIRRNLTDIETRLGALRLPQVGLQLEALGFETRPLRARPWDLARLEPPAMLELDGAFVLLLAAGRGGGVLIGDPRQGLQRLSLGQLEQRFPDGLDVLLIREGPVEQPGDSFGIGWFLPAFQRYPGLLTMTLVSGFVAQLLATVTPLGWLLVINTVVGLRNTSLLVPLTLVLVVATVASSLLSGIRALISADLSDRVDVRLGSAVVEHLLRLPLPYFESRQVGAILYNVNQLYSIRQFLVNQLLGVGLDLVFSVVFLVVLLLVSPPLTLLTLAVVPILVFINAVSTPVLQRQIRESNRHGAAAGSYLVEVLSGMRTVKSQNFEVEARWEWLDRYRRYTNSRFRLTQLSNLVSEGAGLVSGLFDVALLVVAALLILNNQLSIGAMFAVRILSGRMVSPLLKLSGLWQGLQEMKISLACISEVMLAMPEADSESERQALPLPAVRGDLRFEQVSFRYGDRGPLLLDELDLHIEAGQMVGIVGLSGSGKSTLVQMIDRLYRPKSGHIYLDGYDVEKLQLSSLRRRIGYVPQDSLLFQGTVLDNIRLNNPDADIEAVMEAARVAGAHEFILDLEKGYATRLGERGAGLSGGQRQRICLARTVLQDPSFLVLDEATSALDADMERQVWRNLRQRFRGNTVLFITHRLTTLVDADRILYMEKGRIIEDGNHHELLAKGGAYATLYAQQVGASAAQAQPTI